jgi:chromatin segregation and condensation protein Rec8/ScpA/Scc1 (kleisin family)
MNRKIVILETSENIKKVNPWEINIEEELIKVLEILEEKLNFIVAGLAVENSSLILLEKVERIFQLTKERKRRYPIIRRQPQYVPKISIAVTTGKIMIDISDILNKLDELLEKRFTARTSPPTHLDLPMVQEEEMSRLEEIKNRIGRLIRKFIEAYNRKLSIFDILDTLREYSFGVIFLALLYLYMDNILDLELVEEGDEIVDVRIGIPET